MVEPLTRWRVSARHLMIGTWVFCRLSYQILLVKGLLSHTVPQLHTILIILPVITSTIPLLIPVLSIHQLLLPVQNRLQRTLLRLRPLAPGLSWLQIHAPCLLPISVMWLPLEISISSRTVQRVDSVVVAAVIAGQLFLVFLELPQKVLVWWL